MANFTCVLGPLGNPMAHFTCAVEARDKGLKPVLQMLIYPGTSARQDMPSHRALADGYLLTSDMIQWFFAQYLDRDASRDDWRFAPLDAKRSCPWRVARCWQTPPFGRLPKPAVHHRRGALLVQVIVVIV